MNASAPTPYPVRVLTDEDWPAILEVDSNAFGNSFDAEVVEAERDLHEPGRTLGAFDGRTLVGVTTAFSFDLRVPGAGVPAAGVSWVGVLPTHRRRGVLRGLMTAQLYDVHERGREAIAILWASEPVIYGRFGYGLASRAYAMRVPRGAHALRSDAPSDPALRLRLVAADDWKLTADVYAAAAAARPGMIARDERWNRRATSDYPSMRQGRSALRCVVAEDDSGPRGYARYSTRPDWSSTPVPSGTVDVREVIGVDGAAQAALYRYLFDLDLMGVAELWNVPVDDPLLHWLNNTRSTKPIWQDALYVRLVDVGSALSQRTYSTAVDVVLEVSDQVCPWNEGRWRLVGGPDGARCERSEDAADLTLSVTDLGGAYLGGTSLGELAAAGRVQVRAGASELLPAVSAAFSTSPAPWCPFVF
jgi:predicted acetyltransferase